MGRSDRVISSDVRAQLAEALEIIVPSIKDDGTWAASNRYLLLQSNLSGIPKTINVEEYMIC